MTYRVEPPKLGRKIVIKTDRKEGNGGKGGGRKGNTGKKAIVSAIDEHGVATELIRCKGGTFTELKKNLYNSGFVPRYVDIRKGQETMF